MKKSYKIEVDCANCAQKMEDAANTVAGVAKATVSFMTQKMNVEFDEGADVKATMQNVLSACKSLLSIASSGISRKRLPNSTACCFPSSVRCPGRCP